MEPSENVVVEKENTWLGESQVSLKSKLREVVKKKNGYFTVRLTVRGGGEGGSPPPA